MVCPHVKAWKDFQSLDKFVRAGIKQQLNAMLKFWKNTILVAFHLVFWDIGIRA